MERKTCMWHKSPILIPWHLILGKEHCSDFLMQHTVPLPVKQASSFGSDMVGWHPSWALASWGPGSGDMRLDSMDLWCSDTCEQCQVTSPAIWGDHWEALCWKGKGQGWSQTERNTNPRSTSCSVGLGLTLDNFLLFFLLWSFCSVFFQPSILQMVEGTCYHCTEQERKHFHLPGKFLESFLSFLPRTEAPFWGQSPCVFWNHTTHALLCLASCNQCNDWDSFIDLCVPTVDSFFISE